MAEPIQFTLRSLFYVMAVAASFFALTGWFGLEYVGAVAVLMAPCWIPLLLWRATIEEVKSCLKLSALLVAVALLLALVLKSTEARPVSHGVSVFFGAAWIMLSIWIYWGARELWRMLAHPA